MLVRHQTAAVYLSAAMMSVAAGMLIARSQGGASTALLALTVLAGLAILLSFPSTVLFVGWLALTPIFAGSGTASGLGRTGFLAFYLCLLYTSPSPRDRS